MQWCFQSMQMLKLAVQGLHLSAFHYNTQLLMCIIYHAK